MQIQDLATDPDVVVADTSNFFSESSEETDVNILLILGQLDPTEIVDGQPRWTKEQIEVIGEARGLVANWR